MAEVTDLDARLGRLRLTVRATQQVRNEQVRVTQAAKHTRKLADWATVQERHPDVAAHISVFASVFGKPAFLRVTDNSGDVLLDSRRYE